MRPRNAALGIVACVLFVGAFENPEVDHVYIPFDAPMIATMSDSKPVRDARTCEAIVGLPRGSVKGVFNTSAWAFGGHEYWKTTCLFKLTPKTTPERTAS